jgi:hypothetical protein
MFVFIMLLTLYYIDAYTNGISNIFFHKNNIFNKREIQHQLQRIKKVACKDEKYCFVATISNKNDIAGYPFGSVLGYSLDKQGIPILAIDKDACDVNHIHDNNSISLVIPSIETNERIVYTGNVREVEHNFYDPSEELLNYKALFLDAHPNAVWVDFPSVRFYILDNIKNIMYRNTFKENNVQLHKYNDIFSSQQ